MARCHSSENLLLSRDLAPLGTRFLEHSVALVHDLRDTVTAFRVVRRNHAVAGQTGNRLSSSCPSIPSATGKEAVGSILDGRRHQSTDDTRSEVKIRVNDITPATSQEFLLLHGGLSCPSSRRSSGASSEDLYGERRKSWSEPKHLQRSISLNSLDSEGDVLQDSLEVLALRQRNRSASTGEALGSSYPLGDAKKEEHKTFPKKGALSTASQLLKSISTPSIVAAQDPACIREKWTQLVRSAALLVAEEEDEPEGQPFSLAAVLREAVADSDDEKSFTKRKKRGSLFFRKRKGREKDHRQMGHQFVAVLFDTWTLCHACGKPLVNKPALKCDICLVTVHDSGCKDQVMDCTKLKSNKANQSRASIPVGQHLQSAKSRERKGSKTQVEGLSSSASSPTLPRKNSATSYSQWRRAATKLGVNSTAPNKVGDDSGTPDGPSNTTETGSIESLEEGGLDDFEDDPLLRLTEEEPGVWSTTADSSVLKRLKEKEVKQQEAIYELIITEKHHCLTLKIMQKVFAEGMLKELSMGKDLVEKMFPSVEQLLDVHLTFLKELRCRQMQGPVVQGIGDLLLSQFQGQRGEQLRNAYGQFCSRHKEAVALYKDILKTDKKFQLFVRKCSLKPLCKTRGIPECILLVTQRVTKYPLLIDSLLKATKDKTEKENLEHAQALVKEMINQVDAQVHQEERKERLLDIYNRVDAKSTAYYRGKKFKKSDLLSNSRKLLYEGNICLKNGVGKQLDVIVVVLSDVMFFLQESNQKYVFAAFDNKSTVISLQKLLLRERAGQESRGIYLISSLPDKPEMYELVCSSPRDKRTWMHILREAIQACPEVSSETEEENKFEEARNAKLKELSLLLYEKDQVLVQAWEEKMQILVEMLETLGVEQQAIEKMNPDQFKYGKLLEVDDLEDAKRLMLSAASEVGRLSHSLYASTSLSRSVSSAGEHQSDHYVPPLLPKRAETFAGFDQASKALKKRLSMLGECTSKLSNEPDPTSHLQVKGIEMRRCSSPLPVKIPSSPEHRRSIAGLESLSSTPILVAQGKEQLTAIVQLTHQLHSVMCLYSHSMSLAQRLQSEVSELQEKLGRRQQPQKLEELRNLQEQLRHERAQWQQQCQEQQAHLDAQQQQVTLMQEQVKKDAADVAEQRESLFRQLEALQHRDPVVPLRTRRVRPMEVQQLLPLKLSGNHPVHIRAGSSPAKVRYTPQDGSSKAESDQEIFC
ncbi:rho guanine nucleotide exchange factor 2-like isoform X2 [Ornithodoros turicata]|uniref:rho guanine nucleotide exchange factor 2-like isoform X2 n=1 Tax=Ornithodoros turicata TaxID=34597 RepID=UPI003138E96F